VARNIPDWKVWKDFTDRLLTRNDKHKKDINNNTIIFSAFKWIFESVVLGSQTGREETLALVRL